MVDRYTAVPMVAGVVFGATLVGMADLSAAATIAAAVGGIALGELLDRAMGAPWP